MRKELTVFIETTDIDDDSELMIQSTKTEGVVLLTLPNGMKVGVQAEALNAAIQEVIWFKKLNPPTEKEQETKTIVNPLAAMEWIEEDTP